MDRLESCRASEFYASAARDNILALRLEPENPVFRSILFSKKTELNSPGTHRYSQRPF